MVFGGVAWSNIRFERGIRQSTASLRNRDERTPECDKCPAQRDKGAALGEDGGKEKAAPVMRKRTPPSFICLGFMTRDSVTDAWRKSILQANPPAPILLPQIV